MKKILALIFAVCMLSCLLVGCDGNEESQGSQETTAETTTEPPTKRELTATEFGEIVNSIASYSLETQYSDNEKNLESFPYDALQSCTIVTDGDVTVASFLTFDSDESAYKVIEEAKEESSSDDYNLETGANFETLTENGNVISCVGSTVLVVSTTDSDLSKAIISATEY